MKGTLATTMATLYCANIPTALSTITTLSGDQTIVSQMKEDLEMEKI